MENFNVSGSTNFTAILNMLVELNVRTMVMTNFIAENANNGRTYEENIKEMKDDFLETRKQYIQNLFLQWGDLNLGDILGDK
ncbi:hypothetical protein [Pedobacter sp.]|uniref:hypothetical protein n=1 Tax=Pedobacter sp. TaxID=1411316 RepID=UPI00396C6292